MDRQFKKKAYTISVLVSLVFFSIVVATYIDNYTCPMIWRLIVQNNDKTETLRVIRQEEIRKSKVAQCELCQKEGNGASSTCRDLVCSDDTDDVNNRTSTTTSPPAVHPLAALVPNSVFHPHFHYIPCNMMDLLVHCYSVWFILFMVHKWLMYKRAGWHYFMLDYCYFHNVLFIFLIFYILVKVDVVGFVDTVDLKVSTPVPREGKNVAHVDLKQIKSTSSAVLRSEGDIKGRAGSKLTTTAVPSSPSDSAVVEDEEEQLSAILHMGFSGVLYSMSSDLVHNLFSGMLIRRYLIDTSRNGLRLGCKATQGLYDTVLGEVPVSDIPGGLVASCDAISSRIDALVTPVLGPASVTEIYLEDGAFVVSDSHSTNKANRRPEGEQTSYLQEMSLLAALQHRITRTEVFVRVQPLREAVADLTQDQKARMVVLFIMFLSGSFGPILGAIVIWKNALLFHSVDKMTACFLHLAPGLVTLMLLNSIHSSSQVHLFASGGSAIDSLYSPNTLGASAGGGIDASRGSLFSEGTLTAIVPSFVFAHPLFNTLKSTYEEGVGGFNNLADSAKKALYENQHKDVEFLKNLNTADEGLNGVEPTTTQAPQRRRRPTGALRTSSVFLTIFSHFISLKDFIFSHFVFFCLWQVFYHTTFELLAARRKIVFRVKRKRIERKIKKLTKEVKKEVGGLPGSAESQLPPAVLDLDERSSDTAGNDEFEEIEVYEDEAAEMEKSHNEMMERRTKSDPSPPVSPGLHPTSSSSPSKVVAKYELLQRKEHELQLLGASGTNPTNRVTAYTYMMENPPMGKKGPLYRCATLLGTGPFVSKVMFNVMQWIFHCVFLFIGYIPLYLSLIVFQNVFILAAYFFLFLIFSIWNSAGVLDGWIRKLQKEADVHVKSDVASAKKAN